MATSDPRADDARFLRLDAAFHSGDFETLRQELGAEDGFPPLIAALSTFESVPGSAARSDAHERLALLLARGADVARRGINDYTPLHIAAGIGDLRAVDLLLAHGADASAATRIDDGETPLDVALGAGHMEVAARLRPLTPASSRPESPIPPSGRRAGPR